MRAKRPRSCSTWTALLPRGRILQIVNQRGAMDSADGRDFVTLELRDHAAVLESPDHATFDGAFVNGAVEHVADPVALLRRVRAAVRPGGAIVVVAAANNLFALRNDQLPAHAFTPATLLRLA